MRKNEAAFISFDYKLNHQNNNPQYLSIFFLIKKINQCLESTLNINKKLITAVFSCSWIVDSVKIDQVTMLLQ